MHGHYFFFILRGECRFKIFRVIPIEERKQMGQFLSLTPMQRERENVCVRVTAKGLSNSTNLFPMFSNYDTELLIT
jgi:hypothetical protein